MWGDFPVDGKPVTWETGYPSKRVFIGEHGQLVFSYITQEDVNRINNMGGIRCILYRGAKMQSVKYTITITDCK